mmetsp:Transcript_82421/g.181288  ORF Transcript_82421/g.181288 Transcript_82421/m.181288 type:complete len:317 (+) Transcript_82421:179-1129(+)
MAKNGGEPFVPIGERHALEAELEKLSQEADSVKGGSSEQDQKRLLTALERSLHIRRQLHSISSPQVADACHQLCEACNWVATQMLNAEPLKGALALLKRAEQLTEASERDRAITWNNLACYYRRTGKLRTAVTYLERALAIEEHVDSADAAQTHLNLCATLSQLQRRPEAIMHAQSALIRMYETLSPLMLNGQLSDVSDGDGSGGENREQVTVLCIAYHNLAVEYEYLKNFDAALTAYTSGLRWATRFLDETHQIKGILRTAIDSIKAKTSAGTLRTDTGDDDSWARARKSTDDELNSPGSSRSASVDSRDSPNGA